MEALLTPSWLWQHVVNSLALLCRHLRLVFFSISYVLVASSWYSAQAQVASCLNSGTAVPNNFSTWNWEEEPYVNPSNTSAGYRQAYCDTWRANIITGSQIIQASPLGSPWLKPGSVPLQAVSNVGDYKKADGWELVRFDFGASGTVPIPYFMLYNKGTGVLRVFAYIVTPNPYTGLVFTLLHSANNSSSGHTAGTRGLAISSGLIKAPDKYLTQSSSVNGDEEQTTYVSFFSGTGQWAMGQFTMLLDPNITNPAYNLNSYQILIAGLIESKVLIDGDLQYKTGLYADSDFSFSGPNSSPKPIAGQNDPTIKQIVTNTEKFLGGATSVATTLENIRTKAKSLSAKAANAPAGPQADIKAKSDAVDRAASGNVFKDLQTVSNALGGIFGIAGTVIGLFTDDASTAKQAFVPTYAKGTISMKGTITTKSNLHSFFVYTPGTSHAPAGSTPSTGPNSPFPANANTQLSYYTCPMGIFNISKTPVLRKIDYLRVVTENIEFDKAPGTGSQFTSSYYTKPFSSYALYYGDIKPIVNAESGLEIKSVKIAIAQKVPLNDVKEPYVNEEVINHGIAYIRTYNFLYSQISSGMLEAYPYDPGTATDGSDAQIIVQTPFVEAGCLTNGTSMLPFNVPNPPNVNRPVYLRLIAELHKIGTPANSAPVYFAQDYAVDVEDISSIVNQPLQRINTLPPFQAFYSGGYISPGNMFIYDEVKTGNLTYDVNRPSELANTSLLFDQNSNVTVNGNVTSSGRPIAFRASQSVGIAGALSVPFNSELSITTDFKSVAPDNFYSCNTSNIKYDKTNLVCYYDSRAGRTSGSTLATASTVDLESPALTLSPNPSSSSTLLQLKVAESECINQADLLDVQGKVVWRKTFDCSHKLATNVALNGLPAGIYIMRVTTSVRTYTGKLAVE